MTDLSAFYLDILKDRLYVSGQDSLERRSAQTVLSKILLLLMQDMAPILCFTAEEVYKHMPEALRPAPATVFGLPLPQTAPVLAAEDRRAWELVEQVRSEVTKAIEPKRKAGEVGHPLDTHISLFADADIMEKLKASGADLREVFIVSKAGLAPLESAPEDAFSSEELPGLKVVVAKAPGDKCARCWTFSEELGANPEHEELCPRCAAVMAQQDQS